MSRTGEPRAEQQHVTVEGSWPDIAQIAMAIDGLLPKGIARVNSHDVSRNAVLVSALGVRDGTYALPALIGSLCGVLLGPLLYLLVRREPAPIR